MDYHDEPEAVPREDATEQVEDYLRLEEHIAQLQANRRPRRPTQLPPDQVRIYQTAALFRAAAPGAADLDPTFVAQLRTRVEREARRARRGQHDDRARTVSRRNLLAGGLTAAAAAAEVVAGVGLDRATLPGASPSVAWKAPLVPKGTWVALFAAETLPLGGVRRFVTDQVVGFVRHTTDGFEALSGACTHMGCLLAWNETARTFDCPCHGGRFQENGQASPSSPVAYQPLPWINTKVEDGQVWVFLPAPDPTVETPSASPRVNPYR